ncbi:MAG TPA: Ig-like domain-containing protein, partial [Anaerolineae bacterium]|nr:Ig-like domain-containing protein [Anaerolineae bacterium]
MKSSNLLLAGLIGLVMSFLISACTNLNNEVGQVTRPVANITSPQSGSALTQGQEILITFNAADVRGIAQVELTINGQAVMVEQVNPPVNSYTASYRWLADTAGNQVIELQAFNVDQEASEASQISITVLEPEGTVEATLTVTSADTPTVVTIADTPTSLPPVPDTPTPVPSSTEPAAATNEPTITMLTG